MEINPWYGMVGMLFFFMIIIYYILGSQIKRNRSYMEAMNDAQAAMDNLSTEADRAKEMCREAFQLSDEAIMNAMVECARMAVSQKLHTIQVTGNKLDHKDLDNPAFQSFIQMFFDQSFSGVDLENSMFVKEIIRLVSIDFAAVMNRNFAVIPKGSYIDLPDGSRIERRHIQIHLYKHFSKQSFVDIFGTHWLVHDSRIEGWVKEVGDEHYADSSNAFD